MKSVALAFVTLIVGAIADPTLPSPALDARQGRLVTGQIESAIKNVAQAIRDAGLDPYEFESASASYEFSNPALLAASAFVENVSFTGLSDIAVNRLRFNILTSRLTFDISLPRVELSVGDSGFEYTFFGRTMSGSACGSLALVQPRINGNARVSVGIFSGISIRSLSQKFSLGGIDSGLSLVVFGNDLSDVVNTHLGATIPNSISDFTPEINEIVEAIVWRLIEEFL